ncbi:exodeoxyribonuclease III [Pseudactinotalea suaedae]|uniref:exodeoxyribonuclease III n=1 Tax=Pseudactinotalea suaedae TaxID=1524924 RepID=UPI0012E18198|nr:exodeoxyribonuclease III [Pseudactinotalea suaedae]
MRIATWNVNSIRARAERVAAWLERNEVDVLAMQETKAADHLFPYMTFEAVGYEVAHVGTSQWNGVAIASRVGLDGVASGFAGQPGWGEPVAAEARALGATCGGVRVWSVYVPNGRSLDDPHYLYKLDWLRALREAAAGWPALPTVVMGDWNVAPTDADVWDPGYFEGKTHVSDPERTALAAFAEAGFTELTAAFTPGRFTYWDYQRLAFPKNRGMRIDLAFGNPAFAARLRGVAIDREERKGAGASDHVPVVLEVETGSGEPLELAPDGHL